MFRRNNGHQNATESAYREAADKFHDEWVSHEITGEKPTPQDDIQSAVPYFNNREES